MFFLLLFYLNLLLKQVLHMKRNLYFAGRLLTYLYNFYQIFIKKKKLIGISFSYCSGTLSVTTGTAGKSKWSLYIA